MNGQQDVMRRPVIDAHDITSPAVSLTRPLYWSVRRELWESRSIWIAPVAVAAVTMLAFMFTLPGLPTAVRGLTGPEATNAHLVVHGPYGVAALAGFATAFIVGVVFCLEALQGERRDRSILFWKSMPVSDRTTVLSKAMIPLAVLPLIVLIVTVATHVVMLVLSSVLLLANGSSAALLLAHVQPMQSVITVLYAVVVLALWHAPIYGWLLLVSAWARRTAALWATVPLLALGAIEKIVFGSTGFFNWLRYLLLGWEGRAFAFTDDVGSSLLRELTPGRALSTPSIWIGLLFTALCLVAAVRLRRYREPV